MAGTHWRQMHDRNYISCWDLIDRGETEHTFTIEKVERGEVKSQRGKSKMPMISFVGQAKKFGANVTCCKTIGQLYGNEVEKWHGKQITLYVTSVEVDKEQVACLRVRPVKPAVPK